MTSTRSAAEVESMAVAVYALVMTDIGGGAVPGDIRTYVELHDHVDANSYLEEVGVPYGDDLPADDDDDPTGYRIVNAVTDRVNEMLIARDEAMSVDECSACSLPPAQEHCPICGVCPMADNPCDGH